MQLLVGPLQIKQIILPMRNCFPEIQHNSHRELKETSKQKKPKPNTQAVSYRGITLKEYFRLCQQNGPNETLKQIKEESRASSNSSIVQTPTFNQEDTSRLCRGKMKTEVCEVQNEHTFKSTCGKIEFENKVKGVQAHSLDKNQKGAYYPMKKKDDRKKIFTKIHSQPTKEQINMLNRSTLNSFYQVQENKRRMLKKIQQQKERVNDLRLSEAFFITKYGSRFRIDSKVLKNN